MINNQIILLRKQGIYNFVLNKFKKITFAYKIFKFYPKQKNKWKALKNKYRGERVFLIGNGPSLNETPLYLLKNEKIMCFNRFHLMLEKVNWTPDFYTIVDNLVLDDLLDEFENVLDNAKEIFIPAVHIQGDVFVNRIDKNNPKINWFRHKLFGSDFSTKLPYVIGGGTVIFEGFQILKYLGFSEIVMIGVDMNYKIHKTVRVTKTKTNNIQSLLDDDPNHFDPRYFGKGKKYHQPETYIVNNILSNLKKLSKITDKLGIKIINAGYNSNVEYFPKVNFMDFLNLGENECLLLFNDTINSKTIYKNLEGLKSNSVFIALDSMMNLQLSVNYFTDFSNGKKHIKKNIFTHVCFGPFEDKLFFVSRNNLVKTQK